MNPDSTISAIRPSMIAEVSTTIRGSPLLDVGTASASEPRMIPTVWAAPERSFRLATVRPSIPRPRNIDTPSGSREPNGGGNADNGKPSRSPINRPSSNPTTAVMNSAVERSSTRAINQLAGTTVRYGRIANPTITQAITQAASRKPAYVASSNRPRSASASTSPVNPPSAAPSTRM